ncbi:MAG TPA: DUF6221 family protein [Streptosporangiaceae bacterium]
MADLAASEELTDGSPCPDCGERLFYRHGCGAKPPPGLNCLACGWAQDHFGDAATVTRRGAAAMSADLAAFLRARLDEAEARAWAVHDVSKCDALLYEDLPADAPLPDAADCECGYPARVLREVAAKRAILDAYERAESRRLGDEPEYAYGYADGLPDGLRSAVLRLAAVWQDHPGYDPEWAP